MVKLMGNEATEKKKRQRRRRRLRWLRFLAKFNISTLLIICLLFAVTMPVLADEGIVDHYIDIVKLSESDSNIEVSNGALTFEFYKDYDGYNVIRNYYDGSVLVYDDRVTLEYLVNSKWRQRGTPYEVTYQASGEGYIVSRHYTDYNGTTYTVDYDIQPFMVKMAVNLHSGLSDQYRIVWSLSGITKETYQDITHSLDFEGLTFNWSDVYYDWGSITTYEVTTQANGKKADIAFDIGYVEAGQNIELDPKYEYYDDDYTTATNLYGDRWRGQTFTTTGAYRITSVKLLLGKAGTPNAAWKFWVSIKATADGHPTGDDLCVGYIVDTDTLPGSAPYDFVEITLGEGAILDATTMYAICFRMPEADSGNNVKALYDNSGEYAGGTYQLNNTAGEGDWTTYASYDWLFENWGEELPDPPTVASSAADEITHKAATLNGEITDTGGDNAEKRGFVWDDATHGDPGNTAPGDSDYEFSWTEDGDFGTGVFDHGIADLEQDTTYYWRACAMNEVGWSYSDERNFTTELLPLPGTPTDFTITQTGTNDITITWTTGEDATSTVIRVKEGSYPVDIDDGYELYNGALETVDDNGLSLMLETYYIRAWSHNDSGYSTDYAEDNIGGESMLFIAFLILPLGLTIAGYGFRKSALTWAACGGWMILGGYSYTQYATVWDLYYSLFFLCMGLVLISALEPVIMRERKEDEAEIFDDRTDGEILADEYEGLRREMGVDSIFRKRRTARQTVDVNSVAPIIKHNADGTKVRRGKGGRPITTSM